MVRVVVNVYRKQFVYGCRLLFTTRNIAIIILVICESRHATMRQLIVVQDVTAYHVIHV